MDRAGGFTRKWRQAQLLIEWATANNLSVEVEVVKLMARASTRDRRLFTYIKIRG